MTSEAGFTTRWSINPANPDQYVILTLTGSIICAPGLAVPKDTYGGASWNTPRYFGNPGAAADIAVVDWDDPGDLKGYVMDTFGGIHAFGTDTPTPANSMEDFVNKGAPFYRGPDYPLAAPDGFEQFTRFFMYPKSYDGGRNVGYGWSLGGSGGSGARLYRWGGSHSDYPRGLPQNFLTAREVYIGPDDDGLYVLYQDGVIWAVGTTGQSIVHNISGSLGSGNNQWRGWSVNWPRYIMVMHTTGLVGTVSLTNPPAGDNTPPSIDPSAIWGIAGSEYWENIHFHSFKNPTDVQVLSNFALRERFQLGAAPVATNVAITGTTTTTQPLITWTYSQDRADRQESYKVRVYSVSVTQQAGFVVGQGTNAAWQTGKAQDVASGGQGSDRVGVNLADGTTYVAYVQVRSTGDKDSAWSSGSQFSIAITPPAAPSWAFGSPSTDPDALPFGTVSLAVNGWTSPNFIQFQVSVSGGAYQDVWDGSRLEGGTLTDEYQQTGTVLRYRARQFYEAPLQIASVWVYSSQVTLAPSTVNQQTPAWRLIDPFADAGPTALLLEVADHSQDVNEPLGTFDTLSRGTIILSSGIKGRVHHLELYALDQPYYENLTSMLFSGHSLMLQSVFGDSWFVRPTERSIQILRAASLPTEATNIRHAHKLTVDFVEVVRPGS